MSTQKSIRPTKKQRDTLLFIEQFIQEHGYSPSYREIMHGLDYTSVATVSLHVNSLIRRGHLHKRDRSARSLEVVGGDDTPAAPAAEVTASEEKWLVDKVDQAFRRSEAAGAAIAHDLESLHTLVRALQLLELEGAAASFEPRLQALRADAGAQDEGAG